LLKPQDVVLLLKIVARGPQPWSYNQLAYELGMSASEVHAGARRTAEAGLLHVDEGWGVPDAQGLDALLVHGVRYVWAPRRGGLVRGTPTGSAAPPLAGLLPPGEDLPDVWADPDGAVRGIEFEPLYKSVPVAARRDPVLYALLALVDAIRGGPAAVREAAVPELRRHLGTDRPPVVPRAPVPAGAGRTARPTSRRLNDGKERQRVHR
jgi:hypothetical protein